MLGTRRPAALDQLELERAASSKIPKEDALSIYEATLQKLRQGSRHVFATAGEGMKHGRLSPEGNACSNGGDISSSTNADQTIKS